MFNLPKARLELAHCCQRWILSPLRLPFRHFGMDCIQFSICRFSGVMVVNLTTSVNYGLSPLRQGLYLVVNLCFDSVAYGRRCVYPPLLLFLILNQKKRSPCHFGILCAILILPKTVQITNKIFTVLKISPELNKMPCFS